MGPGGKYTRKRTHSGYIISRSFALLGAAYYKYVSLWSLTGLSRYHLPLYEKLPSQSRISPRSCRRTEAKGGGAFLEFKQRKAPLPQIPNWGDGLYPVRVCDRPYDMR